MRRLWAATVLEWRVERRYGVVPMAAGLGAVWTLVLFALPADTARVVVPYLLFVDTAGFGALFVVALLLFERTEGARQALAATPLRGTEAVAAKLVVLTALSLLIAVPMVAVSVRGRTAETGWALGMSLAGVALTSLVLLTVCLVAGARARDLSGFLLAAPVVAPLVLVPLLHVSGVVAHPLTYLVPTTVGADLILWGIGPRPLGPDPLLVAAGVLYALVWVAVAAEAARRGVEGGGGGAAVSRRGASGRGRGRAAGRASATGRGALPALAGFVRVDLLGTGRGPLMLVMLVAPVLLALLIRVGFPPVADFLAASYGFDLVAHTPAVLAALVLLHVPMMFGVVGGLRAVEDRDENVLLVLCVSPLSLRAYLAYRLVAVTAASLVGLAVALPLSGLMASGWSAGTVVALVLASAQAALLLAGMTALAANKVEALVVVKGIGAVMVLVPVVLWALPRPWGLFLLVLPPAWPALALPGYASGPLGPWWCLAGGAVVTAVVSAVLVRRTWRVLHGL
ncbi:hypothetical protein A6A08_23145 [Nocardiopsis sp. TSRI0078]|uniref:fluoroquinolone export ABC transporter permease subunit n=1 Tax=unclassified Nocardiopsis TaxID=2649073 RepID=UPI00093F5CD7|nr:hypothetical protein [Nocardiopsis sp. TSRI0078]OKI20455.1 hypothetical protein A6A08_23145 [Nocardiopsis sp. TSRI0078]